MSDATSPAAPFEPFGAVEVVKRTRIEKIIARTMVRNATTIPHVTHHDEIDVTALEAYRRSLAPEQRYSPLIYLIKAVVDALTAYPQFNASLSEDGEALVLKKFFNIGIAVDSPLGLLVPVLRDCDTKDLAALAAELREVTGLARTKGLAIDRMSGGCFSISSLGGIGGTYFTPIINAPEVAIRGVTGIQVRPVWDGAIHAAAVASYDHRVINGADAARFVRQIGATLAAL